MTTVYTYVLVSVLGVIFAAIVFGFIYLLVKRYRRGMKGDIYIMPDDTRPKGELPVDLRGQRDYRYKDARVDPYKEE